MQIVRHWGRISSELARTEWGASFRVIGAVDAPTVDPVLGSVIADLSGAGVQAAVCDYREADLCIGARRLFQAHKRSGQPSEWATALVVAPPHLEVWRDYAQLQARRGQLRGVFTNYEEAETWARRQAALRETHIRWLAARARSQR